MDGGTQHGRPAPRPPGDPAVGALPSLRDQDIRVFEWITRAGLLERGRARAELGLSEEQLTDSVRALTGVHLLRRPADGTGELVPLAPEAAVASVVSLREAALRRRLADTERLRAELLALAPAYAEGRRRRLTAEPVREVVHRQALAGLLAEAAARCAGQVRSCHPGAEGALEALARLLFQDSAVLGRQVRLRTLYRHTAQHDRPTREQVRRLTARGAEVRTVSEVAGPLVAFDEDIVFIPRREDPEGAVVIRDPSTVAYLCGVFDQSWSAAAEFGPVRPAVPARTEVRQAIVRLLAEGLKDEVVARRLGMSLRTCRKHIAEIMGQLGARSRFQAGHLIGRGVPGTR
jgi:hypothetical protein